MFRKVSIRDFAASECTRRKRMPSTDCPACDGSGYVEEDESMTRVCTRCDGTGGRFIKEHTSAAVIHC
jgi:DnaJ-class molecular chaperone